MRVSSRQAFQEDGAECPVRRVCARAITRTERQAPSSSYGALMTRRHPCPGTASSRLRNKDGCHLDRGSRRNARSTGVAQWKTTAGHPRPPLVRMRSRGPQSPSTGHRALAAVVLVLPRSSRSMPGSRHRNGSRDDLELCHLRLWGEVVIDDLGGAVQPHDFEFVQVCDRCERDDVTAVGDVQQPQAMACNNWVQIAQPSA